jgi:3'-phosphoadenosine 5'-phosphosulfate sulfotransferase (PAPS reductase)/FAD synthetase
MSALGELPRLDVVITADTGWERQATYEARDFYVEWLRAHGLRVEIVSEGNIKQDGAIEHIHIPFFTSDGGPLQRQCTRHFKIVPIKRRLRELAGYHATRPPHPPAGEIELWLGISWDEFTRMKESPVQFMRHRWPLIELKMSRNGCIDYLAGKGLPVPPKSACIGCPYRSASEWLEMREEAPDEWREVVIFDESNRHNPLANSTADELYVYKQAVPLAEADLEADAKRERQGKQLPLMICESGFCMV